MGTLGRKIDSQIAISEYNKLHSIIKSIHCNLGIDNMLISGSVRRDKNSDIGDIDIILVTLNGKIPAELSSILESNGYIINASGSALIRMLTSDDVQIDLYSCDEEQLPMMMCYLTGPSDYNIQMRAVAKRKGFKLNQVALMREEGQVIVSSEEHLFNILGCEYIEPIDRINFYDSLKYHSIEKS